MSAMHGKREAQPSVWGSRRSSPHRRPQQPGAAAPGRQPAGWGGAADAAFRWDSKPRARPSQHEDRIGQLGRTRRRNWPARPPRAAYRRTIPACRRKTA